MQYQDFDWKVIKTEHFDIYYYSEFEEMAEIGAYYAEEAYEELKVKFNNVVLNRIPLIFYNTHIHFQQTNTTPGFIPEGVGGFFEFLKGRVVIPYLGAIADFRHVIRHELVHVFTMNKIYRVNSDHRVTQNRYPPLWFIEGLAEHWSTEWDSQAEMVMRDAILNNIFYGLENIWAISGSFLMYKEGQSFLGFVEEKYGDEKILMLLENIWQFDSFEKNIEYVLGKTIQEIDAEWLYYLKQKYYPLMEEKMPAVNAAAKITFGGFNFSPSYYKESIDGKEKEFIYFLGNINGYSSIYKLELQKKVNREDPALPEIVVQGEREEAFEAFHLLESSLNVSAKGDVVFVSKSGPTDEIYIYSIKEDKVIKEFQYDNLISISSPKWSLDGNRLVFEAIDQKGYKDLFVLNISDENLIRITNDYYSDRDPVFGKEGNKIIFASDRTEGAYKQKFNVFEYDMQTGAVTYLTYVNANFHTPVFSPDFKNIYFTSDIEGVRNIWKMQYSPGSDKMTRVSSFTGSIFDFTFSDSSTIVLSSFEKFSFQFYKYDVNRLPDSLKEDVFFDFKSIGEPWAAEKIIVDPQKDKYNYKNEYTLDYAQSQVATDPVYGTRGGALLSLSDLFGDDIYYLLIYNTAEVQSDFLKSFNVAITRYNLGKRANYGYGIFHYSGRRYDLRDVDEYYFERSFGGYFSLVYPISTFRRIETSVSIANSDKEVIEGVIERKALLVSNSLSYVFDNTLWGPTGPMDGSRMLFLLGFTSDVKYNNVNYFTVIGDYRNYFRLGLRSSLAFRSAIFYNEGKEARRYIAGGSWDLRGWPRWSVRGEKLWLSSLELRIPLIDLIALRLPFMGIGFSNIRGAVFADAGGAWDDEYEETLGSVGFGLRLNLFNILTLRYDMGKKVENNLNDFQKGLFYQFFFGWDF